MKNRIAVLTVVLAVLGLLVAWTAMVGAAPGDFSFGLPGRIQACEPLDQTGTIENTSGRTADEVKLWLTPAGSGSVEPRFIGTMANGEEVGIILHINPIAPGTEKSVRLWADAAYRTSQIDYFDFVVWCPEPTATPTFSPTPTDTPTPTPTSTSTPTSTPTATATPTSTPEPTATPTATPVPPTETPTPTATPTWSPTPAPSPTPTVEPTEEPKICDGWVSVTLWRLGERVDPGVEVTLRMEGGQLWGDEIVEVNGEVLFLFVDSTNKYYIEVENTRTGLFKVGCGATKKVDLTWTLP